jgi:hypothetical protein
MAEKTEPKKKFHPPAIAEYSCGHAAFLSGFDDGHRESQKICPICHQGTMEEMRRVADPEKCFRCGKPISMVENGINKVPALPVRCPHCGWCIGCD